MQPIQHCEDVRELMNVVVFIFPPKFCKSLFLEEGLPGKDVIDKLKKAIGNCNDLSCFVECWFKFNDDMVRAGQPDPWQNCGLENDEDACLACCDMSFGSRSNPARQTCKCQCSDHY